MKIIAIAAISIDGKIATDSRKVSAWTSREDKVFLRKKIAQSDIVIAGNNTFKTTSKLLDEKRCIVLTKSVKSILKKSDALTYCNPQNVSLLDSISAYKNIAILGGSQVYSYCLENDLIDELFITIEPLILGEGLNLFNSEARKMVRFNLVNTKILNNTGSILLHYKKLLLK